MKKIGVDRLKCAICESAVVSDKQSLPRVGKVASEANQIGQWRYEREREDRLKRIVYESVAARSPFPNGEGKEEAASPPQKEANPASLRSAAPSKGRGLRGHSRLPMEGGAPKGRRLDGESGIKKIGGDRLKCVVYESTLSTAARFPFPKGENYDDTRMPLFLHCQSEYTHMWKKRITTDKAFPSRGRCPEGADRVLAV